MGSTALSSVERCFTLERTLDTPSHISSLAFGHAGHLFAGSDDGSLRVYDLSTLKVLKAVRGLGSEVSSIVCMKRPGSDLRDAWIAHGQYISKFKLQSDKMIQTLEDAVNTIKVTDTDTDILNELALNANKSHIAYTTDSGVVGVLDLLNDSITKMETKHESVCGSVKFVPGRPRELISGGYDNFLLHFDFTQGKVLSRRQIDSFAPVGEISLSPPFVMCLAMSDSGILAAGIADGRLWIGFGGEKALQSSSSTKSTSTKKKGKKWEGLGEEQALLIKVAEGPIVAMAFSDARKLTISTLMGVITQYHLIYDEAEGSVTLQQLWQKESTGLEKVNAMVGDDKRIIVGGFSAKGHGVIEIWREDGTPDPTRALSKDEEVQNVTQT